MVHGVYAYEGPNSMEGEGVKILNSILNILYIILNV